MSRFHALALTTLVSGLIVGCPQQKICAPGTVEQEGQCLPVQADGLVCGPGTSLVNNQCVLNDGATADTVDGSDAPDTTDASDTFETADAPDAGETVDSVDAPDAMDVADIDGSDTPDAPDNSDASDLGDMDDGTETEVSDSGDVPVCVPLCVGKACGDDGCGGSCGSCDDPANPVCNTLFGQCVAVCVPNCTAKACGDDGCGGVCGTCGVGTTCDNNQCLPPGWTCDVTWFAAQDACDCGCGAPDPDCDLPDQPLAGCGPSETCVAGVCQGAPPEWTCDASTYNALDNCDCGCGAPDPDCEYEDFAVLNCMGPDPVCLPDATCEACVTDCTGKVCGDDGCGGLCGICEDPTLSACDSGQCVDPCGPTPLACETNASGDDGCGGSCGGCAAEESCELGQCVPDDIPPDPASCLGYCGSVAPAGCYCSSGCADSGLCCDDFVEECSCTADCAGKTCGGDGCGGSCGACDGGTPFCGADQNCTAVCAPDCADKTCGDDGCGGSCGSCGVAASCSVTNHCVPDAWTCPLVYYDDGLGCDCGCGAPDPDCDGDTLVLGCPTTNTGCSAGVCEVTFCDQNSDCTNQWCTGAYGQGDGNLGGVCAVPNAQGAPPGTPCVFHQECASGACLEDQCRWWCTSDSDCAPDAGTCRGVLGHPVGVIQSGGVEQVATVCDLLVGSGAPCDSQLLCNLGGETCGAIIDPATLGPKFVCGPKAAPADVGANCDVFDCARGLVCTDPGDGDAICALPCPAGGDDCGVGETCAEVTFHSAGTTSPDDDPMVPVCLP